MLKQKLVEHGKNSQTSYKTGITTNALLQFIRNRMENNTLFLLFVENAEDGLPKTLLSNECEKARTENIILTDLRKECRKKVKISTRFGMNIGAILFSKLLLSTMNRAKLKMGTMLSLYP